MTKVLVDACVLFPTILRDIVLDCAKAGLFEPLWSEPILEEWHRAAIKNGVGAQGAIEIALVRADWRAACVDVSKTDARALVLPDENDRHVLAAAIAGGADELLTANSTDFPTRILAGFGVVRRHPDEFLLEVAHSAPKVIAAAISRAHAAAERVGGVTVNRKKMLQKSGLPRLAKWIERANADQ
jgi:hypothetical protein